VGILEDHSGNGWKEYQRLVLADIKRLNGELVTLRRIMSKLHEEIAVVKVKMGIIGSIGGLVAGGIVSVITWLLTR